MPTSPASDPIYSPLAVQLLASLAGGELPRCCGQHVPWHQALEQHGINHTGVSSHSFRLGAVMAAAQAGMKDALIQVFSHWHSPAYLRYVRIPPCALTAASAHLLHPHSPLRTLTIDSIITPWWAESWGHVVIVMCVSVCVSVCVHVCACVCVCVCLSHSFLCSG